MSQQSAEKSCSPWLTVTGEAAPELECAGQEAVARRISAGHYRATDVDYILRLNLPVVEGALNVTDRQLEKLRRLCQLADVDLVPARITSHRAYIGPLIVAAKKVLFSILKVLFKDTLRKQRDFNAAVISYLAESAKSTKLDK